MCPRICLRLLLITLLPFKKKKKTKSSNIKIQTLMLPLGPLLGLNEALVLLRLAFGAMS